MSNKPYDFLTSDKEPIVYLEKTIVKMDDGKLCLLGGHEGKQYLAPCGILVLMLGAGTSITQEAAIYCAQSDTQIAFAKGGTHIHSFFMSGRYQDPQALCYQMHLFNNHKFEIAKKFLLLRIKKYEPNNTKLIDEINKIENIQNLMLSEARWTKDTYKKLMAKRNFDIQFTRNFDGTDTINERLNILNNVLYSICTAIILSCNLSPSVGFMHGETRRGGLTFDLADIFKYSLCYSLAFSKNQYSTKELMWELNRKIKDNNFQVIKNIIKICLILSGNKEYNLDTI